jgi:PAS domain-containing protein
MEPSCPTWPLDALRRVRELTVEPGPGPADVEAALAELRDALGEQEARLEELCRRVAHLEGARQADLESLVRYRELFEFAPDPYLVTDLAGVVLQANQAATVLFNRPREFLVGTPCRS